MAQDTIENLEKIAAATSVIQPLREIKLDDILGAVWNPFLYEYQNHPLVPYLSSFLRAAHIAASQFLGLTPKAYADLITIWEGKGVLSKAKSEFEKALEKKWATIDPFQKAAVLTAVYPLVK